MDILIKGVEMPKNCSDCPLAKSICFSTKQYVPLWEMARKRQEDCPIVKGMAELNTHMTSAQEGKRKRRANDDL